MRIYGLTWTEATGLRLWELSAMEEDYEDRRKMEENRKRLS